MPGQLQAYRFINAKLRARIGELLDERFFRTLAGSASVDDAVIELADRGYGDVADAYRDTGDLRMCEQELFRREVETLLEVERYLTGTRRSFVALLADRYEIENLKTALRLWFEGVLRGKHVESKVGYLSREPVHRDLDLDRIVNAANPGEIPAALEDTPYAEPVRESIDQVQQQASLFSVERALDRDYLARLLESARALPGPDRDAALTFVALEADRENVSWIARAVGYYGLEEQRITAGIVPGGRVFDTRTLERAARSGRPTGSLLEKLGRGAAGGPREGGRQGRDLELIEAALDDEMDRLVHRFLGSYPFTMGVVLAYDVLSARQLRRISTVLNGLSYGLEPSAVEAAL
jgi:V/A-type H+-transporting ATPase subunit C